MTKEKSYIACERGGYQKSNFLFLIQYKIKVSHIMVPVQQIHNRLKKESPGRKLQKTVKYLHLHLPIRSRTYKLKLTDLKIIIL